MTKLRFPHKAYRLLGALRRIGNPDDEERIAELRLEIGRFWSLYAELDEVQNEIERKAVVMKKFSELDKLRSMTSMQRREWLLGSREVC